MATTLLLACRACGGRAKLTCPHCRNDRDPRIPTNDSANFCSEACYEVDNHAAEHSIAGRTYGTHGISRGKAREMLSNPPHNRPLTKRQRAYFNWVAYGEHRD
jgi:hypothetical protein